jgi:hypothetical protein
MADELAVAESAPQMTESSDYSGGRRNLNEAMFAEIDRVESEGASASEGTASPDVEHESEETSGSTPQDALTPDADDVPVYETDPHSVRDRVNKLNAAKAAEAARAAEAEARATSAEARAKELEERFNDYVPPELEARGFKSRAELAAAIEAENRQREEHQLAEQVRAYREQMYSLYGEEYGEKLVKAELLNQETQRRLQAHEERERNFQHFVSAQQAQEQASRIINSSLEKVPAAVHETVRGLLATVPVDRLPPIADALTKLVHDAVNDARSSYAQAKAQDRDLTTPTPEGSGGRSPDPTGAAHDWRAQAKQHRLGNSRLSDLL